MKNSLRTDCITNVAKKWWLIDAKDVVLGRLASKIAMLLRGKHKPEFTPNMDNGDNIIITNAEQVTLTSNKLSTKKHYWHTGYIGGIKSISIKDRLASAQCTNVIRDAVKGMLPKNRLSSQLINNLYIYSGPEHNQQAQQPEVYDFINENRKNR